jgi:ABC-2 type transport system permease protein
VPEVKQHNLRTVIGFEVRRTLGKKRFWLMTLGVPIAIGIVFALVIIGNIVADNNFDDQSESEFSFTYTDGSGFIDPGVASALGGTATSDPAEAIASVKAGKQDAHFVYPADPTTAPTEVYGVDKGLFENGKYSEIATQVLIKSAQEQIGDPALANLAQGNVQISATTFTDGREAAGLMGIVPPLIFLVMFFLMFFLLANQMLTSTMEEKENRVTEMILTTLNPTALITGKIISLFVVGFVQALVFLLPVLVGYVFFRSTLNLPNIDLSSFTFDPAQMIVGALLAIGGFALFTSTTVAIGAVTPTAKDAGNIFSGLAVLMFIPLYAAPLIISDPQGPVAQLFTYFPYSAPVTAMLRNAFESLTGWEAAIAITELFLLSALVLQIAVRLFRTGSIQYNNRVSLKIIFARSKALKAHKATQP